MALNDLRARRARFALLLALVLAGAPRAQVVTNTRSFDFGRFVANGGGSVIVDTNGARSATGAVFLLPPGSGASAAFSITDPDPLNASRTFVITLPDTVTLSSGGNSMVLSNFVSAPNGIGTMIGGSQSVAVGATLTVAPGQAPGNYSGSIQVTINYQ